MGDGAIWVVNSAGDDVSRVDLRSKSVQTIPVGASPSGIAVCRGGVWVANHNGATVSWISPQTNTQVRLIQVGAGPTAVACGFGSVWVTNADDRTVTRINANTGDANKKAIRTNAVGADITVGGGLVWVTDEATRNIYGLDPARNAVTEKATVGAGPTGIAYADGSLWVANSLDDTVSKVDLTTLQETARINVAGGPSSVSFSGGSVWVSSEFGSRIVRIDPNRAVVAGVTSIGNRPEGLASGADGVWVAVQASGKGHRGGRLVVVAGGLDSIDPATASTTASDVLIGLAYDGLTAFRRVGGAAGTQIEPDLAAALPQPTANGTTYTFHLQPGIRYSSRRPVRAADFRRSLSRELEMNAPAASPLLDVEGARACLSHKRCDLSRGVIVKGASTLTFRLSKPDSRFPSELTWLFPVPPGTAPHDIGTKPVPSTGPYAFLNYVPGHLLTLVRNRYFHVWSAAARPDGYPDEIVYRILGNEKLAEQEVLAGTADLAFEANLSGPGIQQLQAHHARQLHLDPQYATTYIVLNVRRAPFNDIRVRRALNYAVDRQRIATLGGSTLLARPTCQVVPPNVPGYRPVLPLHDCTRRERRVEGARSRTGARTHPRVGNTRRNRRRLVVRLLPSRVAVLRLPTPPTRVPRPPALHQGPWSLFRRAVQGTDRAGQLRRRVLVRITTRRRLARLARMQRQQQRRALLQSTHRRANRTAGEGRAARSLADDSVRGDDRSRAHEPGPVGAALYAQPPRPDVRAGRKLRGRQRYGPDGSALGPVTHRCEGRTGAGSERCRPALICGEEIDRQDQVWRIVDVTQPSIRPFWEAQVPAPHHDDSDYVDRLGELDGYPAHLECLRRVVSKDVRDDRLFRKPSR